MTAAACLTLALLHGFVWFQRRTAWGNLLFALLAVATSGLAATELWMMRADTPEEYGTALRWVHVPGFFVIVSIAAFVRMYFRAGRVWLAWTVFALRALALVLNFSLSPNLNFREITALRMVSFLGERVATATGVPNPWMLVGQASLVAVIGFVVDAGITAWRRGDGRRAAFVCGAIAFFITASAVQAFLSFWQWIPFPVTGSLFFAGVVVAMGYELSRDVLRAAELSSRLMESERQASQLRQELAHTSRVTMMGQLAATLAHELNQPLGAILRNAEAAELFLAADAPDLEELRAIVTDIRKDDQRAGNVIDRMRALLTRRAPEMKSLEIPVLIEEVTALVRADAAGRRVVIKATADGRLPPVRGDRVQIQQVLLNLILNGMDALNGQDGERRLAVHAQRNSAGAVEIAVSDNGHGIPAERADKLFEPFFTTKAQGMGMGLAISRTIIEAHGGEMRAENSSTRGATFYVTLPPA